MLSKAKIASEADLSTSIVKYYMENYKEFFTPHTVEGSPHPVYGEDSIAIVKRIRELTQQNKNREQIKDILKEDYHPVIDMVDPSTMDRQPVVNHSPSMVGQPLDVSRSLQAAQSAVSALTQLTTDYEELVLKQERLLARRKQTVQEREEELARADERISELEKQIKARNHTIKQLYNQFLQTDLGKTALERLKTKESA